MMYFLIEDPCTTLGPILRILKTVFVLLQWAIPFVLVLLGAIDLGKAVVASKEDEMKKAQGILIKRVIYAIVIFFLFTLVNFVIGIVGDGDSGEDMESWSTCWKSISVFE